MSAGLLATLIPAASSAAILSSALPEPPEMIAPAWPIRLPGGAVCPAMNAAIGLVNAARLLEFGGLLLGVAADLAHHHHGVGVGVSLEHLEGVDEAGAVDRVAADPDAGALADPEVGQLPDSLIRERPRPAHHADPTRLVDVARHDPDLALARGDDAGAIRADQADLGVVGLEVSHRAGHVEDRNPLGDRDDQRDPGVGGFEDRVGGERRRHEDHRRVGAGLLDRIGAGVKHRHAQGRSSPLARGHPADQVRAIVAALLGVKRPRLAGDPLADQPGVLVNQDAHAMISSRRFDLISLRRFDHWKRSTTGTCQPGNAGSAVCDCHWPIDGNRRDRVSAIRGDYLSHGVHIPDDQSSCLEVIRPASLSSQPRQRGHNRSRSEPQRRKREFRREIDPLMGRGPK